MKTSDTIYVTGHRGLVGSAIVRQLKTQGFSNIWCADRAAADLRNSNDVDFFFNECKPEYVFHCAAKVGGIQDNIEKPADFLCENLEIQSNVFRASHKFGVKKLLFLSSAAVYPDRARSPLSPEAIMTGPLDETKGGYAMAKLCGMQMCKEFRKQFDSNFISVIPNNVYGPGDKSSHVIPDMMRRFQQAKITRSAITCWGMGRARREFIFADDLAEACVYLMGVYDGVDPVNVGVNRDWSISELAKMIANVVGFEGPIFWDSTKPEGTAQRLLNSEVMNAYGWLAKTSLLDGLYRTYKSLLQS